jgi:tetratricopeptide (TPR) repeat protein
VRREIAIAWLLALLIGAAVVAVYAPAVDFPFVAWQDDVGLLQNKAVRAGLSAESVGWAFTETWGSSHGPLAIASHLLDFTLFGSDAGGHHATSILLHALNAMLVFGVLASATGAPLRSAAVALLLALHPIHVESVAWISERAGLLGATFGIASLGCYVVHVRRGSPVAWRFSLLFLLLSLLAKPMLVSLPLLLLLVDVWPLGRTSRAESGSQPAGSASLARLAAEKWPWLLLAAAFSVVTLVWHAHAPAVAGDAPPGLAARAANAVVSVPLYVWKLLWPTHLAVFHPYPRGSGGIGWGGLAIAGALGAIAIPAALSWRARHPATRIGLLWYAIALVPVLGIVPIGPQAIAERYAYVPAVGVYIALVFGMGDALAGRSRSVRIAAAALFLALLVPLALASRAQLETWRSSEALFRHATEVTRDNAAMHFRLATTLEGRGQLEEAIEHYRKAVEIRPDLGQAHYRFAGALMSAKQLDAAKEHYRKALDLGVANARDMMGLLLVAQGDLPAAITHYREEVQKSPGSAEARAMLAYVLSAAGDLPGALREYRTAAGLASEPSRWAAEIEALERHMRGAPRD